MDSYFKKIIIFWVISLSLTTVLMLFLLLTGETSLNFSIDILLVTLKFLSGFGLILSITSLAIFVLEKFSDEFKGNENRKNIKIFLLIMLLIPIALLIYNGYNIYASYKTQSNVDNIFDQLIFIYGVLSLIISLYIKPTLTG
ncbi:MAG: hypothetical protein GF364_20740, partial [Candidatus Lokiarchaeota archaeon]|nr:hypothetical protein [Candidatus Lokiarchaeota archaeon]